MQEKNLFHDRFVRELSARLRKNELVAVLDDILNMGSPSIYRRLRGEVEFSFGEIMKIAQVLHISIDKLFNSGNLINQVVFDLHVLKEGNPMERYLEYCKDFIAEFGKPQIYKNSEICLAYNIIPVALFLNYSNLTRFFMFKYVYQSNAGFILLPFSKVVVPDEIIKLNKIRAGLFRNEVDSSEYIFDHNVFKATVQYIKYFVELKLISSEELQVLQKELMDLLLEVETLSVAGQFPSGKKVFIYIAKVNFDHPYFYFKSDSLEYLRIKLHGINYISSRNAILCGKQKEWLDSLKRYAVLITKSCEMERFRYFNEQREYIRSLITDNVVKVLR